MNSEETSQQSSLGYRAKEGTTSLARGWPGRTRQGECRRLKGIFKRKSLPQLD